MTVVDHITRIQHNFPNMELVRAQLTATGTSTFVSKFGTILMCIVQKEGTNTTTYTWSTRTVTITGTDDDFVDIMIIGKV
ncbi:MAG: hypothetical protein NTW30_04835 [Candidatus Aenigmarchaeota archaeon]|nr:hypothetical protein [Candidatus Aenigmarchaeota archaeon]